MTESHNDNQESMPARALPMLPASDLDATETFYRELGFHAVARYPDYLILMHGELELHFAWLGGEEAGVTLDPHGNFAGAYLRVMDADLLHDAWKQTSAAERMDEIEDKPWGLREFHLVDLDGNLLRVGHIIARHTA